MQELDEQIIDRALWQRAADEAGEDDSQTRERYIQLRAAAIEESVQRDLEAVTARQGHITPKRMGWLGRLEDKILGRFFILVITFIYSIQLLMLMLESEIPKFQIGALVNAYLVILTLYIYLRHLCKVSADWDLLKTEGAAFSMLSLFGAAYFTQKLISALALAESTAEASEARAIEPFLLFAAVVSWLLCLYAFLRLRSLRLNRERSLHYGQ